MMPGACFTNIYEQKYLVNSYKTMPPNIWETLINLRANTRLKWEGLAEPTKKDKVVKEFEKIFY